MGMIARFGQWLDKRFPEKINADEVYRSLTAYNGIAVEQTVLALKIDQLTVKLESFSNGARAFDEQLKADKAELLKEINFLKDEMNKAKAVLSVMNKVRTTPVLKSSEPWKR